MLAGLLALGVGCASPASLTTPVPPPGSLPAVGPAVSSPPPDRILPPPSGHPLPDYAAPRGWVVDPQALDQTDVISYRALSRGDFRGTEPPEWIVGVRDRVGAATCGHILTTPDTALAIEPQAGGGFEAQVTELRFVAQMDRRCSWWNPQNPGYPDEYILQHEQIHFALFELEARRLDAAADGLRSQIRGVGSSQDAAHGQAQAELNRLLGERVGAVLERSRQFDQDTSLGYDPAAQERWWREVNQELDR
jgi:hypothetical protein